MDAQAKLDSFIQRYNPAVAADGERALAYLAQHLPAATRLVYDNYNALVVGFACGDRVGDVILSIAFYPRYVTLFFARGVDLPDPHGLLEGSGTLVRSVRLQPIARLETQEVGQLIDAAIARAKPLPASGQGRLIIKSVSAKQRPRRSA